ncbi:hypothetical protein SS7213T_12262 [Staphylococcus simiae CCM 7213 = CCUG 51256]|uniref:Uncharacterized protein n=2 Tax=Staphylococcus simiae TaxID=308354 RepID=G5JLT3_9STAP|nr:hypothetical protein SS7213T_12262 [Staphylococcus simiae CCM 7213 = CCUG 51256]SNV73273.1 membrane-bound serine protease [Staphylococcus simiae]
MDYINVIKMTKFLAFTIDNDWIKQLSEAIVNPVISLLLTCIVFLGFVYQLYSKHINAAGILSSIALLLLFFGFLVQGDVNLHSVLLFSIGVILVVIELFVVGAVIGLIGMTLITISIITLGDNLLLMLGNVIVALIFTIIEWVILVKIFNRKIPFLDKVILKDSTSSEAGYISQDNRSHLVGKKAQTVTDLRPAGIIFCENERIDAVSDGNFILRNKTVEILEVEGSRVVVRETN